jgi:hypothetical protein
LLWAEGWSACDLPLHLGHGFRSEQFSSALHAEGLSHARSNELGIVQALTAQPKEIFHPCFEQTSRSRSKDAPQFRNHLWRRFGGRMNECVDMGDDLVAKDPSAFFCAHGLSTMRKRTGHEKRAHGATVKVATVTSAQVNVEFL